jgi:uncharacterized protein (TIGR02145 family)
MKRLTFTPVMTLLMFLGPVWVVYSQSPEGFTYQAEARDSRGKILVSTSLIVKALIIQGSAQSQMDVWDETYNVITDKYGLFSIVIGDMDDGEFVTGRFSEIDWEAGPYFLNVEIQSGSTIVKMPTTQLLSVPYALYAKRSGNPNADWNAAAGDAVILNKPMLSEVATSGSYNDLSENPDLSIYATKNMTNGNITNLANPIDAQDAATKIYIDALAEQLYEQGVLKVKDVDGNFYGVVKIGAQFWMSENLKTTKCNDGSMLPMVTDNTSWEGSSDGAYCWYNNNDATIYGAIYNWYAVNTRKLCPVGWHVPSDAEWATLITFLGGESVAGGKMKESGTLHWKDPNTGATNESGFSGLPGGYRIFDGRFLSINEYGVWWSSTGISTLLAQRIAVGFDSSNVYRGGQRKDAGYYVRCVRD